MLHLKELRTSKGITQTDLAKALGISASAVGMYEQRRREPDNDTLVAIAKFFQVTTDYLLGTSNNKNILAKKPTADLLDALFHDDPELLARVRNIDIKGKINEPGIAATLTEHQKARLKDIIMFTIDESIRNGRTLVRIHSSKEGNKNDSKESD